jgi:hypothetical protein
VSPLVVGGSLSDPTVLVALIGGFSGLAGIVIASFFSTRNQRDLKGAVLKQSQTITEIHVLVNSKMDEALQRVAALEAKLGLEAGEAIPTPQIITGGTSAPPAGLPESRLGPDEQ